MRKLIILFLSIIPAIPVFSQSETEIRILNELNLYRSRHGLRPVSYDRELSKPARHHAVYVSKCLEMDLIKLPNFGSPEEVRKFNKDMHDEIHDIRNWKEYSIEERIEFIRLLNIEFGGEVISIGGGDDHKMIIEGFHDSPGHREIIRGKGAKIVGIGNVGSITVLVFGSGISP
jgi:hypothetical protein